MDAATQIEITFDTFAVITPIYAVLLLAIVWHPMYRGSIAVEWVNVEGYGWVKVPAKTARDDDRRIRAWVDLISILFVVLVIAVNVALIILRSSFDLTGAEVRPAWMHWTLMLNACALGSLLSMMIRFTVQHFRNSPPAPISEGADGEPKE